MANSLAPSASRAPVALVGYADFVDILILVVRDVFGMPSPSVVKEEYSELRLCAVVHGSRRAGL